MVGNGQHVPVVFVISVVVIVCGHLFEIYIIVPEIHEGTDIVFVVKNMVETGVLRNFKFISRSIPILTMDRVCVWPKSKV